MDTYEKRNLLEKSYQSAVHEAWKQFIANKPIREKDIPPHILRSWKLSREAGMDPAAPAGSTGPCPPRGSVSNCAGCAAGCPSP